MVFLQLRGSRMKNVFPVHVVIQQRNSHNALSDEEARWHECSFLRAEEAGELNSLASGTRNSDPEAEV